MYVAPVDAAYMKEHNVLELKIEYRKRFGEAFISFNYCDFDRVGDKCAAQIIQKSWNAAYAKVSRLLWFPSGVDPTACLDIRKNMF